MNNFLIEISDNTENENFIPFECPICLTVMRDQVDCISYENYECCDLCLNDLVWPNKTKWDNGWRPGKRKRASMRKKRLELPSYYVI